MRTKVPQSAMDARIIKRGSNAYASLANPAGLETRVLLGFIIGKDGRVTHVFPISGSELLQTAAMQEVRQRIYQPYLVAGEPVEVESEIAMVFDKTH